MRLHQLSATAFGPFADTVEVDFDALSEAGLFLLAGPTGAGKTSVLDAVCFALYGDVPGDRSSAKRFRCDAAAPGVAPRVELELTVADRRLRLSRSPAWTRPKKRGTGTTTEQASVVLEERVDGAWQVLSTRLDETGHQVSALLGMTMTQFCQVAMLPQGRFQAFLRARSEDRHKLLQRLFSTRRFEEVERWVRERARELRRASLSHQRTTVAVLNRVQESADTELPDGWDDDLAGPAETGALQDWMTGLRGRAERDESAAATDAETAAEVEDATGRELDAGVRTAELRARGLDARTEQDTLDAEAPAQQRRLERLEVAGRCAAFGPLSALARQTRANRDAADEAAYAALATAIARPAVETELRTRMADELPAGDPADLEDPGLARALEEAERRALDDAAAARAQLPRVTELARVERELTADGEELATVEARIPDLRRLTKELPVQVEELTGGVTESRAARDAVGRLDDELSGCERRLEAHQHADDLERELTDARAALSDQVTESQRLKEVWLSLREARVNGMAAELAAGLAVGCECPVCGSPDHPHKAVPEPGAPTVAAEKEARSAMEDAEVARTALDEKVRDLTTRLALVRAETGDRSRAETVAERDRIRKERELLAPAAARAAELEAELAVATRRLTRAEQDLKESEVRQARLATATASAERTRDRIRSDVAALLEGSGHDDLSDYLQARETDARSCADALRSCEHALTAREAATQADAACRAWLEQNGFDTAEEALAGLLPEAEVRALETAVESHRTRLDAVTAVLAEPEVRRALDSPSPDLDVLRSAHQTARQRRTTAESRLQVARRRAARLRELAGDLTEALAAWGPARAEHRSASDLASFLEGKSADNELRMRLSAYVLSWRLTQVVDAANERLQRMSDQRYTLEHTGQRGAGETRGGLSLLVRDEWTGDARDPATLSGGETFVVALALALGLADVVAHEAGGTQLDTLFVDEGFGSLDADTLDDVLNSLDDLREGGRVIGVVSHVSEMRDRIPTRLAVAKDRRGSTLRIEYA